MIRMPNQILVIDRHIRQQWHQLREEIQNTQKTKTKHFVRRTRNETSVRRNGKRVTHVKAQVQPYPVESVEIVEWLLWVDILLVVDWGDFISTPTYTGILERLRHYEQSKRHFIAQTVYMVYKYTTKESLFTSKIKRTKKQKWRDRNEDTEMKKQNGKEIRSKIEIKQ